MFNILFYKGLSALGELIGALTSGAKHLPYRNHVLTELMSDSLGGTAKTLMFVNVSPADYNSNETKNSLQVKQLRESCEKFNLTTTNLFSSITVC